MEFSRTSLRQMGSAQSRKIFSISGKLRIPLLPSKRFPKTVGLTEHDTQSLSERLISTERGRSLRCAIRCYWNPYSIGRNRIAHRSFWPPSFLKIFAIDELRHSRSGVRFLFCTYSHRYASSSLTLAGLTVGCFRNPLRGFSFDIPLLRRLLTTLARLSQNLLPIF